MGCTVNVWGSRVAATGRQVGTVSGPWHKVKHIFRVCWTLPSMSKPSTMVMKYV